MNSPIPNDMLAKPLLTTNKSMVIYDLFYAKISVAFGESAI
jgi:hypothetical protein